MNQPPTPRAQTRAFRARQRATLARLRRVNEALSRWDEINAAAENESIDL